MKDLKKIVDVFEKYSNYTFPVKSLYSLVVYYCTQQNCLEEFNDYLNNINKNYNGNIQLYIEYINKLKSHIILTLSTTEEYKNFTKFRSDKTSDRNQYNTSDIWKDEFTGKRLISIDLREANFNIFKISTGLMSEYDNWKSYLSTFTNDEFILNSKHFRQSLFGGLSPNRVQSLQKVITLDIAKYLDVQNTFSILSVNADEVILEILDNKLNHSIVVSTIKNMLISYGYDEKYIRVEGFTTSYVKTPIKFYVKQFIDGRDKAYCVPKKHFSIANAIINGRHIDRMDTMFEEDDIIYHTVVD